MDADFELWLSLGYVLFMLGLTYIFKLFPPKGINHLYGYRTPRSMRNDQTWKFANDYSMGIMRKIAIYCLLLPALGYVLWPNANFLVTVIVHSFALLSIIWLTERQLKKHFDDNGNPR